MPASGTAGSAALVQMSNESSQRVAANTFEQTTWLVIRTASCPKSRSFAIKLEIIMFSSALVLEVQLSLIH